MACQVKDEAYFIGEVLESFMKLFDVASKHVASKGDVQKMVEASTRLRKATFQVIQETGNPVLQEIFAKARRSFSQSYGAARWNLSVKQR